MSRLAEQSVTPAKKDSQALTQKHIDAYLDQLTDWTVVDSGEAPLLERTYQFEDFMAALDFVNQVGEAAEEVNHHPEITFTWGKATVRWWTHVIDGLHINDFIMAARTDEIYHS